MTEHRQGERVSNRVFPALVLVLVVVAGGAMLLIGLLR